MLSDGVTLGQNRGVVDQIPRNFDRENSAAVNFHATFLLRSCLMLRDKRFRTEFQAGVR